MGMAVVVDELQWMRHFHTDTDLLSLVLFFLFHYDLNNAMDEVQYSNNNVITTLEACVRKYAHTLWNGINGECIVFGETCFRLLRGSVEHGENFRQRKLPSDKFRLERTHTHTHSSKLFSIVTVQLIEANTLLSPETMLHHVRCIARGLKEHKMCGLVLRTPSSS